MERCTAGGRRVERDGDATTVRMQDGHALVFDLPFAETKEASLGYLEQPRRARIFAAATCRTRFEPAVWMRKPVAKDVLATKQQERVCESRHYWRRSRRIDGGRHGGLSAS